MRFWLSWYQRTPDHRPLTSPPNPRILGWWKSGENMVGDSTLVALVVGETIEDAWASVDIDWPPAERVGRFGESVADDWQPGDRFVRADWMADRIGAIEFLWPVV